MRTPLAALVGASLVIAAACAVVGFVLVVSLDPYDHKSLPISPEGTSLYSRFEHLQELRYGHEVLDGHSAEWTISRHVTEWSVTYLLFVGVPFGLVLLLRGGRPRRLWRWLTTEQAR